MNPVDLLVVGAGPAGLAAAIRFKQKNKGASVIVVEKAFKSGAHVLSGAAFEAACLDELVPGWKEAPDSFFGQMIPVEKDEMYFLAGKASWRIPSFLVPGGMHHKGDHLIPLGKLVDWLSKVAAGLGVEIYTGFSARELVEENGVVKGVRLVDQGLGHDGKPKSNFLAGETILARVTLLADGGRGVLSRQYAQKAGGNKNPQVYSVGVKELLRMPQANGFGEKRVVHTLGFPNRPDVFGGGFVYSMGKDLVAVGIILGLDWPYTDLDPQQELQVYKTHPLIAGFIKGGVVIEGGAKTIPEGGFFSLPALSGPGVILAGDAAGFVNMEKIKGIHYAVLSGMAAADAVAAGDLSAYNANLEARGVMRDMRHARNFRAVFQAGLFVGAPLSLVQSFWPLRLGLHQDHTATRRDAVLGRDYQGGVDRVGLAALSGTMHREDEPSHLIISDTDLCRRCQKEFNSPCTRFCPVEVYRRKGDLIHISASNCVHCGTCAVKCPLANIVWTPPEGGEGPRYKMM